MEYQFRIGDTEYQIVVEQLSSGTYKATINDKEVQFIYKPVSENCISFLLGNKSYTAFLSGENQKRHVLIQGEEFEVTEVTAKDRSGSTISAAGKGESGNNISAPMPGRILKILVSEQENVQADQPLFIVESMKMENEVRSPGTGKVKKINFEENALVSVGDPVVELEQLK